MKYSCEVYRIWMSLVFMHKTHLYTEAAKNFSCDEEFYEHGADRISFSDATVNEEFKRKDLSCALEIYERCVKENIKIICMESPDYPEGFKDIPDPPIVLYAVGDTNLLNKPLLTVVGSRSCDGEGRKTAALFSDEIKRAGIQIVCGFADGIEAAVIKSVKNPIVIIPNGTDIIYPAKHRWLRGEIVKKGGLVLTEYPFGIRALKYNFKYRNRLLAAISEAVLIIQAGEKSGTSITCGHASGYGRDCYAVPGSIYSRFYTGCNKYIREYGAIPVSRPSHIIDDYAARHTSLSFTSESIFGRRASSPELKGGEAAVYTAIADGIATVDEISLKTRLQADEVSSILINLELDDYIINNNGKYSLVQ